MAEEVPVPPQWQPQPAYDFRHGADGPRGYKVSINKNGVLGTKRKLDAYSEQVRSFPSPCVTHILHLDSPSSTLFFTLCYQPIHE